MFFLNNYGGIEMRGPSCQFENPDTQKFYGECGHNLSVADKTPQQDLSFDEKIAKVQKYLPECITEKILFQKDRLKGSVNVTGLNNE